MGAIDKGFDGLEDFALADKLSELSGVTIPEAIEGIRMAPVLHDTVCEKDQMADVVKKYLGI